MSKSPLPAGGLKRARDASQKQTLPVFAEIPILGGCLLSLLLPFRILQRQNPEAKSENKEVTFPISEVPCVSNLHASEDVFCT